MNNFKLAILASGLGSTAEAILDMASLVITDNPEAGIIKRAENYNVPCLVRLRSDYRVVERGRTLDPKASRLKYGQTLLEDFRKNNITHISLNGFELLLPSNVVLEYDGKIVNSHPAPMDPGHPDFGGKGMYGLAPHAAVLNFAKAINRPFKTGISLHKVTPEFDKGDLVAFREVEIKADDSPETLQARVKEIERGFLKDFWTEVSKSGKLPEFNRTERVILAGEEEILEEAKTKAIEEYS